MNENTKPRECSSSIEEDFQNATEDTVPKSKERCRKHNGDTITYRRRDLALQRKMYNFSFII